MGRALGILEILSEDPRELGVSELARRIGVHRATASRLIATLAAHGLVERNPVTDKCKLGFGLVHLAGVAISGMDLVQQARPVLQDLAMRTGETVNVAVLDGDGVLHLDQVAGSRSVIAASWVGRRTPWHCTSNGKVLLAFADADEREQRLRAPLERLTRNTIDHPDSLRAELLEVRARGYAQAVEELEEGLSAVAAPVRRADGNVVAAVSVSGPSFRMRSPDLPRIGDLTIRAAESLSRRMGYVERRQSIGS